MTTYTTARDTEATAARIARIRARRAGSTFTAMEVTVGDIQPGDFVDQVHGQANLRGTLFETAVTETRIDWQVYNLGRSRQPVEATWIKTRLGTVAYPSNFRASIRRPVSA